MGYSSWRCVVDTAEVADMGQRTCWLPIIWQGEDTVWKGPATTVRNGQWREAVMPQDPTRVIDDLRPAALRMFRCTMMQAGVRRLRQWWPKAGSYLSAAVPRSNVTSRSGGAGRGTVVDGLAGSKSTGAIRCAASWRRLIWGHGWRFGVGGGGTARQLAMTVRGRGGI